MVYIQVHPLLKVILMMKLKLLMLYGLLYGVLQNLLLIGECDNIVLLEKKAELMEMLILTNVEKIIQLLLKKII